MTTTDMTTFGNLQFTTVAACVDAICDSWMTGDGTTHPNDVRAMLSDSTDRTLVLDLLSAWSLPHSAELLEAGMARLRERFAAEDWPQVYRDNADEYAAG